ncbi:MAG: GntR family transcriptional regulator [Lentisphaerae bacterium]|nr:GntR family transcriptional regulator [Lentisphaerota bacterium]
MADIRQQIADGQLKPGDQLLSVGAMRDRYGVSHQTAAFAMAGLVREGVIRSLPRKGYFVAGRLDAPALGSAVGAHVAQPVFDAADKMSHMFSFRHRTTTLSLYVMDNLPEHVLAWRAALAAFERRNPLLRVTPIFPNEGGLSDVLQRRNVDIVHWPHDDLKHTYPDRWLPCDGLESAGMAAGDVLPIVNAIRDRDHGLVGAPMSLTTRYLYVNLDLYRRFRSGDVTLATPDAILDAALEFERSAAGPDEFGLWPDKLFEDLVLLEAVEMKPGGRFQLNADRLRQLIPRLAPLRRVGMPPPLSALNQIEQFRRKRALFCWQFSFNAPAFDLVPDLNWAALAPPSQQAASTEAYLTVLAIDRQTDFPEECRELVRYLCSEPVMAQLARPPALLPVRRGVLDRWSGSPRITRASVEEIARRFSAFWPVMDHAAWDRVDTCGYRFVDGSLSADALLEALQPPGEGIAG